jgi:hypothetical protein
MIKIKNLKPAKTPTTQTTPTDSTDSTEPTKTKPSLKPKIDNKFAVVPYNKVIDYLGNSLPMKESLYDELLIELEENPNKIKDIKTLIQNPETGTFTYRSYDETSVSDKYELALLVMEVDGKDKAILVRNVGPEQLSSLSDDSIVIGATKASDNNQNIEVKLRSLSKEEWSAPEPTTQAPKTKKKMTLEELEDASTTEDPFSLGDFLDSTDQSQQQEAEEKKNNCKTGSSKINKLRGSRKKGPDLDL